ncbi:hypothetical protein MMC30_002350 [Trapelia coarctata]|nr:hypothetical protein [Trapelia coarctata]
MAPPLQVICLISGGKDSFYSLLHCLANGHNVIALANLFPPPSPSPSSEDQTQDLNSYMYQTVGHTLIPLYATALGLPLYRQQIHGGAVCVEREYSYPIPPSSSSVAQVEVKGERENEEDETESLLPLLERIMREHPHATALATGAILSTYQRTRIESVAARLSLIPLSYLWQYPFLPTPAPHPGPSPVNLLRDMAAVGLEARIVKVASGGLDEGVLWGDVCGEGTIGRVERAVGRFGGSVLGEGGEYETLVVGGPRGGWRGRLVVEEGERVARRGGGGEAWVEFKGGRVDVFEGEWKEEGVEDGEGWKEKLKMPELWDERFGRLLKEVKEAPPDERDLEDRLFEKGQMWDADRNVGVAGSTLFISNLAGSTGSGIEEQMAQICTELSNILATKTRSPSDIVFTTLLLRSMADFAKVNAVYGKLFTKPNPPARVTVGAGDKLPKWADVVLSVVVHMGPRGDRKGLHVQSRSYWAPANIGPYSQAIAVKGSKGTEGSLVYVAGQIPLVPATMEALMEGGPQSGGLGLFRKQAVLALQHLWRIGLEMDVSWWMGTIAFVVGGEDARQKALIAWLCWDKVHQRPNEEEADDEDAAGGLDAWDKKYGGLGSLGVKPESRSILPDFDRLSLGSNMVSYVPGFFAIQMNELPRGCEIEWQNLGIAHCKVDMGLDWSNGSSIRQCTCVEGSMMVAYIEIPLSTPGQFDQTECLRVLNTAKSGSPYFADEAHVVIYTPYPATFSSLKAQFVPCKRIWGCYGVELAAGIVARCEAPSE